jgi:hypothetical protein
LPAISQLLGAVGPLVGTGEVGHKLLFKIYPAIDTAGWQVVQPYPGWSFKYLWHIAYCPPKVSSGDVHCRGIIF